jgi:serine/threonine protein phosphatase 1
MYQFSVVARYEQNTDGRDFVCGDIHGCYDDLEDSLEKTGFDTARDRMFCVGDLFDRGPRSRDALEYLGKDWFFPVRGNHEDMFLEWFFVYNLNKSDNYRNGSDWQFREKPSYLGKLAQAVRRLPLIIVAGENLIVHAGLPDVLSLEAIERKPDKYAKTILWHRGRYPDKIGIPGIKRVYCGHSITDKVEEQNGFINIDTGAFLRYMHEEGKLTVVELLNGKIF